MATMQFNNINKIYPNGVQAVFDFNMEVKNGEFIVFVGPSGCGKSTTLRMVAGLEEISSGDLLIDDLKTNDKAPKDRDIAMVFQNYALYSHMTVYHNMAFSLVLRKANSDYIHERVMWAAEVLGLTPYLNRRPANLSGGQRQRVALGRAIVRDPKVFLLDEPLSNLDAKLRTSMRKELKALHRRLKSTMIYVTHDQIEALTLADRIVILNNGYIQQIGTPSEVYDDPANQFVANFIGTPPTNIIPSRLTEDGTLILGDASCEEHVKIDISKHEAFSELKKQGYFGHEVTVGIRPEYFQIDKAKPTDKENIVDVDFYELLGAEGLIHFTLCGQKMISKMNARFTFEAEDKVKFKILVEHLYFFDNKTENRIYGQKK